MQATQRIEQALRDAFAPTSLAVEDDSHRHIGHAGHDGLGESHFRVTVVSPRFDGMSRIDRQRRVHDVLKGEFAGRLHALQLTTLTPAEAERRSRSA